MYFVILYRPLREVRLELSRLCPKQPPGRANVAKAAFQSHHSMIRFRSNGETAAPRLRHIFASRGWIRHADLRHPVCRPSPLLRRDRWQKPHRQSSPSQPTVIRATDISSRPPWQESETMPGANVGSSADPNGKRANR